MKIQPINTAAQQRGVTMISLMIGLLVAMVGILAMTTMHKSLIQVSVESKIDAQLDTKVATVLTQLQLDLQSAGFGIEGAGADTVERVSETELRWRQKDGAAPDANVVCTGIRDDADAVDGGRKLVRMTANCAEDIALTDGAIPWQETTIANFPSQNSALLTFTVDSAECSPYGFGPTALHRRVKVSVESAASIASAPGISAIDYLYCLANTYI